MVTCQSILKKAALILIIFALLLGAAAGCQSNQSGSEKPVKSQSQMTEEDSLYFSFDSSKYELVQVKGEKLVCLMERDIYSNVFVSWLYIPNSSMEEESQKELAQWDFYEIGVNDLPTSAIKLIDRMEDGKQFGSVYFIDDNDGGVYRVFINVICYEKFDENALVSVLDSICIIPKDKNANLNHIKIITGTPLKANHDHIKKDD